MLNTEPKIVGWRINVFKTDHRLGRIPQSKCEYGNSPLRDKQARAAYEQELRDAGSDFETRPIFYSAPAQISPAGLRNQHVAPLTWLARQPKPVPADKFPDCWDIDPAELSELRIGRRKIVATRTAPDGSTCYAITAIGREMVESHAH